MLGGGGHDCGQIRRIEDEAVSGADADARDLGVQQRDQTVAVRILAKVSKKDARGSGHVRIRERANEFERVLTSGKG